MAGSNRTAVDSLIQALNIPSVTNANLNTMLQTYMNANLRFRLDVAANQNKTSGAFSIDFDAVDRINTTITGTSGSSVTISNLEDGDEKYWLVIKSATETVSFISVTDITPIQDYVTAATQVLYRITKKGSNVFAESILNSIKQATETIKGIAEIASTAEAQAGSNNTNIITPAKLAAVTANTVRAGIIELATATEVQTGTDTTRAVVPSTLSNNETWTNATITIAGGGGTIKYRKNNIGNVEIYGAFTTSAANGTIFTLPAGYRPSASQTISVWNGDGDGTGNQAYELTVTSAGAVIKSTGSPFSTSQSNSIQGTVFLDN